MPPNQPPGGSPVNIDLVVQALKAIAQACNAQATAIGDVFPTTGAISTTDSGASGKYLTIVVGGTAYKLALLLP
jgi:hypothetical protein